MAEAAKVEVEDLIYDLIDYSFSENMIQLTIIQYKKGALSARDAWKISGLSYKDFQTQVLLSALPQEQ